MAHVWLITHSTQASHPTSGMHFNLKELFPLHQAPSHEKRNGLDPELALKLVSQPRIGTFVDCVVRTATAYVSAPVARDLWIAFSCSNGRQLSVAVATQVHLKLRQNLQTTIIHRELPGRI